MKMSGLKKGMAILVAAMMLLGAAGIPMPTVKAANELEDSGVTFTMTMDKKEVNRGDEVTMTVTMSGCQEDSGIWGVTFKTGYDSRYVEPVEDENDPGRWAIVPGDAMLPNADPMTKVTPTQANYNAMDFGMRTAFQDGVLFSAKFKVKEDAPAGELGFTFISDAESTNLAIGSIVYKCTLVDQTKDTKVVIPVTGITLDQTKVELKKDETYKLNAALTPEGSTGEISWTSDNEKVASVDQAGNVKANASGTAKITASANGFSAYCDVKVTNPLTGISISGEGDRHTLKKGQTLQLTAVPEPADADGELNVTWTSGNTDVAAVSESGLVTAKADGSTTIKAEANGLTAEYAIEVKEIKLTGVKLNKSETTIHRGESEKLIATPIPADTTDDTRVDWESSDPNTVKVDGDGNVTALKRGGATITATMGGFPAKCEVTVDAPLKAIKPERTEIKLLKGQSEVLNYTLDPADTTDDKTVTMTSSDNDIVSVDTDSRTLTGKQAGTATITLTGANDITATVAVQVEEKPVNGIFIEKASAELEKGESMTLMAKVLPEDTTDDDTSISWSSSDESVATVSSATTQSGESITVTATDKGGYATITAKNANGDKAECQIYVPIHMDGIEVEDVDVLRGHTVVMQDKVTYIPANTDDDRTLTWESSDPSVASINPQTGVLTPLKEGEVKVTATTTGTETPISDTATVIVKENHLTEEIAAKLAFDETEEVLKGQKIYMDELLNLNDLVEQGQITDDLSLEWKVTDDSVALIDQSGCLTGLKEGETAVTVQITAKDGSDNEVGSYTAETQIKVKEIPLESIAFDKIIREMTVGEKVTLGILYNPADTTDSKDIEWLSSDPSVLAVTDGQVTAQKAGTATITAKAGKASASMEITVKEKQAPGEEGGTGTQTGTQNGAQSGTGTQDKDGGAKTGVNDHAEWYIAGMLLSAAALLITLVYRKKIFR